MFTLTTALCLAALAAVAVQIDARSRGQALDGNLDRRATGLARAVYYDQGVLHLEPLHEDELAQGPAAVAVVEWDTSGRAQQRFSHRSALLPKLAGLSVAGSRARHDQETVVENATAADGRPVRLAAAPVWDDDRVGAVVLAAGDPAAEKRDHERLERWLFLGGLGLVLAAGGAGHLLSGRSMRPALRALDQQEQFLSEAAHELRTPLATLRLVMESGARSREEAPAALGDATRLVDQMGRLVAGLLTRARVQIGTQEVERTALRLDQVVETVVDELPTSAAVLRVRTEPTIVYGDPELLAQAVRNLIDNALKHGVAPKERAARIDVSVADGRVVVRDHGPGVPTSGRERVFDRRTTGPRGGTGIGLAIVRWVADLHGGTARISEASGGGAVAELVVPLEPTVGAPLSGGRIDSESA
ncbi:HAMP domain-containing sensor histidine kinase [Streptomyces sp. NPDC050625]|uniref:sensor histidine kinase n=1 Tax=Streptomyces sp. NPDC050625 TaxID=3154629 RepID=UPI00341FE7C7